LSSVTMRRAGWPPITTTFKCIEEMLGFEAAKRRRVETRHQAPRGIAVPGRAAKRIQVMRKLRSSRPSADERNAPALAMAADERF